MPNGRDVLVWRDGFPDWKRAGDLPELWSQPGPPPPSSAYPAGPGPMTAQAHQTAAPPRDLKHLLFGFDGRVNRAKYWLVNIANIVVLSVLAGVILGVAGFSVVAWLILGLLYLVALVVAVAICVKRLHDRNRPGWWAAIFIGLPVVLGGLSALIGNELLGMVFGLAQFAVAVWGLIELGILRGTVGPNQYGEDPLAGKAAA